MIFRASVAIRLGGEEAGGFELAEAVAEDVGGDAFAGGLELFEGVIGADHEVADDQQRPAVSEDVEGDADGAAGATLRFGLRLHGDKLANVSCDLQVLWLVGGKGD